MQHYPTINESNYQNIEILIQNELENIEKLQETLLPEQEQLKTTGDLLAMTEKVIGGTYVQSLVREERERRESDFIRCILPCWFLLLWHSKVDTCSTKFEPDVFSGKVDTCGTKSELDVLSKKS